MVATVTRLCQLCRAVQPPEAERCTRCDHAALTAPLDEPAAFLAPRRRALTGRSRPRPLSAYGCAVTLLTAFATIVGPMLVFEMTGSVGAGLAALVSLPVAVTLLSYAPIPRLRDRGYTRRLTLARSPRLALPSPSHTTIAGTARALDGRTVPSFADGTPCLATSLVVGDPPDRIVADRTLSRAFLVVVDDGPTVVDGTLCLADPDGGTPLGLREALIALGLEHLDAEGEARVLAIRDGAPIEVTGPLTHEAIASLAGPRHALTPVLRGRPGAPLHVRLVHASPGA